MKPFAASSSLGVWIGGVVCPGAVGTTAFTILLVFIVCVHLLEVMLAPQDMRERDPVLFFFEACTTTPFVAMSSLKKVFLWLESLELLGERDERWRCPTRRAKFVITNLQRLNFYKFNWFELGTISMNTKFSDSFSFKDGFSNLWIVGGTGLFIGKLPIWKSRWTLTWVLSFDLGFGPFNEALP